MDTPLISIAVPYYPMKNAVFFMRRLLESIERQTYKNYEVIITQEGKMAENTNAAMRKCTGELIKVMYMDDYFISERALEDIIDNLKGEWMMCGCDNNISPQWTDDVQYGNNRLGSPSALVIKNKDILFFDERLGWLLDCDYYRRLYDLYGPPDILEGGYIGIGIHDGQSTVLMGDEVKLSEYNYMKQKYKS